MSPRRWYRSLYWRIAFGLIVFLALMLAAEGAAFLWMTDRIAGSMPARSPRRLAALVASDVGTALARDRALDLTAYLKDQYGNAFQTFVVILRDGRVASNHDDVPAELMEAARLEAEERRLRPPRFGGPFDGPPPGARPPFGIDPREPDGRGGPGFDRPGDPDRPRPRRRGEFAAIVVDGRPIGRVAVLPGGVPYSRVLRELGPTLALVGCGVLAIGTAFIAFVVFGPSRRRLKHVQEATERLGAGDLTARAPEGGADEVAAVAHSFNRMADELTERARQLDAADRTRRQLLADVSHELMTPLTAMRGYIETLTMDGLPLDQGTRDRYLRIIEDETHRLERIVGDLLDLARLEGGGSPMRREAVRVRSLFDRVAARHGREAETRGITIATHAAPGAEELVGDPDRLEQALQNLAANALRHTPDGGRIELRAEPAAGGGTRLTVRDSGPGIDPAHLPLIFDRFYKADAARKAAGGSGLGLSIVRAIVEAHGGTVTARNDQGAVFEIVLAGAPVSTA